MQGKAALPDFHANFVASCHAGDQSGLAFDFNFSKVLGLIDMQSPPLGHDSGNGIIHGEAGSPFIQPDFSLQLETVRGRGRVATIFLNELHRVACSNQIGREGFPVFGKGGSGGVHRCKTFDFNLAQFWICRKDPYLLCGPGAVNMPHLECFRGERLGVT